jgi:hypothetical protein
MIFPVLGPCEWTDTWGQTRGGGSRKHLGQDLPATKLRPLLAAFNGVWDGWGVRGDDGAFAKYLHLNNDTPGTDDGNGGEEYATAPGIWNGVRVVAGQHVAYCGDSGNAEEAGPHLHFELSIPNHGNINPAASLRAAKKITMPRYPLKKPEFRPAPGKLRIDGQIVGIKVYEGIVTVRVAAWANANGKVTPQLRPTRRRVRLPIAVLKRAKRSGNGAPLRERDFVAIIGKDTGKTAVSWENGSPCCGRIISGVTPISASRLSPSLYLPKPMPWRIRNPRLPLLCGSSNL